MAAQRSSTWGHRLLKVDETSDRAQDQDKKTPRLVRRLEGLLLVGETHGTGHRHMNTWAILLASSSHYLFPFVKIRQPPSTLTHRRKGREGPHRYPGTLYLAPVPRAVATTITLPSREGLLCKHPLAPTPRPTLPPTSATTEASLLLPLLLYQLAHVVSTLEPSTLPFSAWRSSLDSRPTAVRPLIRPPTITLTRCSQGRSDSLVFFCPSIIGAFPRARA